MATATKIIALLRRHGVSATPGVRAALADFLNAIASERVGGSGEDDEDREDDLDDDHDRESAEDLSPSRSITCPHCGEHLAIHVDLGGGDQDTIQDCEVCCCPIRVIYTVEDGKLASFSSGPG
jgi:hypothetical protein